MYSVSDGREAISKDMDNLLFSSNFNYSSMNPHFSKTKPTFHHHSDTYNNSNYAYYNPTQQHQHQQQQQQQKQSSSLARYRSEPGSFFASLLNEVEEEEEENGVHREGKVEEEEVMMFPEMMNMKQEAGDGIGVQQDYGGGVSSAGMMFGAHATSTTNTAVSCVAAAPAHAVVSESSFGGMDVLRKSGGGGGLLRQSSSPAGFLSNLVDEIGFGSTSDTGSFRANIRTNMNFSTGKCSHSRFMPQITENRNSNVEMSSQQNGQLGNGQDGDHSNGHYLPTIPNDSSFNGLKRTRDSEMKMSSNLSGLVDTQNGDLKHYNSGLLHQLSVPSTSAEMESIENLLQFQQDNVVPCKIRAKRGFATHPRSIAERVRRTRISERMKKLQELFPNMDKQANTADMLDLAVEFIKDLQKEVQTLNETRARCTCSSKIKQSSPA